MKHCEDVNMFFFHTQNLRNELNENVATFEDKQFNCEFCDTERHLKVKLMI